MQYNKLMRCVLAFLVMNFIVLISLLGLIWYTYVQSERHVPHQVIKPLPLITTPVPDDGYLKGTPVVYTDKTDMDGGPFLSPQARVEGADKTFSTYNSSNELLKKFIGAGCDKYVMPSFEKSTHDNLLETAPPDKCLAVYGRIFENQIILLAKVKVRDRDYAYTVTMLADGKILNTYIERWY